MKIQYKAQVEYEESPSSRIYEKYYKAQYEQYLQSLVKEIPSGLYA